MSFDPSIASLNKAKKTTDFLKKVNNLTKYLQTNNLLLALDKQAKKYFSTCEPFTMATCSH